MQTRLEPITFITGNKKKLEEVQAIIPYVHAKSMELPEIQSLDMREVVAYKIKHALAQCNAPIIVEDTAVYMDCLKSQDGTPGLPGPFVKWFLETIGNRQLYEIACCFNNMRAYGKTVVGYAPDAYTILFFEGEVHGTIVEPTGEQGFGWDFVFKPDACGVTLGSLPLEERIKCNQRGIAVQKLKEYLEKG
jgi:inosine triphosphate pyrophosphatase